MNLNNEFGYIAKSGAKVGIIIYNSNTVCIICDYNILSAQYEVIENNFANFNTSLTAHEIKNNPHLIAYFIDKDKLGAAK
ncbi:MAG: hypothetical protein JWP44_2046 [Mucilaginibacter sp.]|nr:hypothetical protein [Mucilaginibacter sp.]